MNKLPNWLDQFILRPYIDVARSIVRFDTDVVMLTHILLYFTTSVPSALLLFWKFSWMRAIFHVIMQASYVGTVSFKIILPGVFALLSDSFSTVHSDETSTYPHEWGP